MFAFVQLVDIDRRNEAATFYQFLELFEYFGADESKRGRANGMYFFKFFLFKNV